MPFLNSTSPSTGVIAVLTAPASRCEIGKRTSDDEAGDPIEVRCGATTKSLGRALKGVAIDRISACRVMLTINAVHQPRLLSLSNCREPPSVVDVGNIWTARIRQLANIKSENVEFVTYRENTRHPVCYHVTVTYDFDPIGNNAAFKAYVAQFCVGAQ